MHLGYVELTLLAAVAVGLFSLFARRSRESRSSWPTWILVTIAIFLAIPMGTAIPDPLRPFRFIVFAIVLSRWSVALVRRERSQGWMFYLVILVAAQLLIYPLAAAFASQK
jgi:drug/metabolite transporter (DMT)-like permease